MTDFQTQSLGKYLLLDKVAAGGMAELYRAIITGEQGFEKLVAIKKIHPHLTTEDELIGSFIDEAKLAALLHHQNIVQIYDFGSIDGSYFISMEYLLGKDGRAVVGKAVEKGIPLSMDYAMYIVARICAGFEYAHNLKDFRGKSLQIIHRDISPQNIFITYEGDVKIIDFGIAKAASQNTMTQLGLIKGKIAYMSPEQAGGLPFDHRSDIFSCGIVLYELVTGKRMFTGETLAILAKVKEADYIKPEEVDGNIPGTLAAIINKALEKDPANRYQSCGEMQSDLEECMTALSLRPTAHGLSRYMKILFGDEIEKERDRIQHVTQVGLKEIDPRDETTRFQASLSDRIKMHFRKAGTVVNERKGLAVCAGAALIIIVALVVTMFGGMESSSVTPADTDHLAAVVRGKAPDAGETPEAMLKFKSAMGKVVNKKFDEAILLFEEILAESPGMERQVAVPYVQVLLEQAEKVASNDAGVAYDLIARAIKYDPVSDKAYFQRGALQMKEKRYLEAIDSYKKVIAINPDLPDAFFNLGFIYAVTKEYSQAEEMYTRVVGFSPPYIDEALFNLAVVQKKQGKDEVSRDNLKRAVAANPNNETAKNYLRKLNGAL